MELDFFSNSKFSNFILPSKIYHLVNHGKTSQVNHEKPFIINTNIDFRIDGIHCLLMLFTSCFVTLRCLAVQTFYILFLYNFINIMFVDVISLLVLIIVGVFNRNRSPHTISNVCVRLICFILTVLVKKLISRMKLDVFLIIQCKLNKSYVLHMLSNNIIHNNTILCIMYYCTFVNCNMSMF